MHEIKPHPGITYYISKLDGTLTYAFKQGDKQARSFELDRNDFEWSTLGSTNDRGLNVAGTDISAVGLNIKLVKNDGILTMQYQGEGGNTAQWVFEGLQETSRQSGMYASAATQTCFTTLDHKPTHIELEPLLDTKTEAFLREKALNIQVVVAKEKDGTHWQISHGGAAERISDEDVEVTEPTAVEPPTVARRVSSRNRVDNPLPYAALESLPRCIYLPGQTKNERDHLVNGSLMLDQADSSIAFETKNEFILAEMVPDVTNEVLWKPYQGMYRLQVFFDGDPEFTSYHNSEQIGQIVGRNKDYGEYTHRIRLEDFISRLKSCLISEGTAVSKKRRKKKRMLKRRRIVSDSEEE